MKQRCVREVSDALGRPIDGVEAQAIEATVLRALREDRKADPAAWKASTGVARVLAAGQRLAREAMGDALEKRAALAPRRLQQFGGENARGIDPTELWRAQEMRAEGADDVAIWRETGWWQNPADGKWRYEIDDSGAAFVDGAFGAGSVAEGRLGDLLAFDDLFAAYPTLADLQVRVTLDPTQAEGGALIPEILGESGGDRIEVNAKDEASAMGIVLHELQHAIQAIEGFAQGGGLESARGPEYAAAFQQQIARARAVAEAELAKKNGLTFEAIAVSHPDIHAAMLETIEEDAAWRTYLRIAGEMEARNVENRRGQGLGARGNKKLGSRARRNTPPSETFDLPLSEAIVPLEDGENVVALRSVAGDALGPRPRSDAGSGDGRAPRRQDSRRPQPGAGARERFAALAEAALVRDRQALGQSGDGLSRGETTIPAGGVFDEPGVVVALFETADRSTPFHEFGHVYLEVMAAYAAREGAPEALTRDYASVRRWLGAGGDGTFTTEQHEKFARGFEAYLREGRAPEGGLARFFAAFRDWLVAIYRSVRELDVELDDEIRGVFDNLMRGIGDGPESSAGGAGRGDGEGRARSIDGNRAPRSAGGAEDPNRSGGPGQEGQGGAGAPIPPPLIARDPELKEIAADLAGARAEIEALELQGRIAPEEAAQARADLEAIEKTAARPELLRAAAFCLRYGARVTPGEA